MAIIRLDAKARKQMIVDAAIRVASKKDILTITIEEVASECVVDTSPATVRRYFHTMADLRDAMK